MVANTGETTVFEAVADPTRRAVLDLLRGGERAAGSLLDLVRRGGKAISQPAFSQHLGVLRRVGLVRTQRRGRHVVYALGEDAMREIVDWVAAYDALWSERLPALGRYLDRTHDSENGTSS